MINRFVEVLRRAEPDLDTIQIAEALWLATVTPGATTPARAPTSSAAPVPGVAAPPIAQKPQPPQPTGKTRDDEYEDTEPEADVVLPRPGPDSVTEHAIPVRAPAPGSISDPRSLQRSLRLLKRQTDSHHRIQLDEAHTAERIAETRTWVPVLRRAAEPWLDLALIVDDSLSVALWRGLIADATRLLQQLGAFRDVRIWRLRADGQQIGLQAGLHTTPMPLRPTGELKDPRGRRMFLVATDGSAPHWRNGQADAVLADWAANGAVGILHLLPERLWQRTGLEPRRGHLSSSIAGAPNRAYTFQGSRWPTTSTPGTRIPVPLLRLEPDRLRAWSHIVTASRGLQVRMPVVLVGAPPSRLAAHGPARTRPSTMTAAQRVARFRAAASPDAFRLCACLAGIPLSLGVMRLVKNLVLPGTGPAPLAEVLLGGLLGRVQDIPAPDAEDDIAFQFVPGVADILAGQISYSDAEAVRTAVRDYFAARGGGPGNRFAAALAGAGQAPIPVSPESLTTVPAKVARRMGAMLPAPGTPRRQLPLAGRRRAEGLIPDPQTSQAVLIGVSRYQHFDPIPSVAANLGALRHLLLDPEILGIPPANCTVLLNPTSVYTIVQALTRAALVAGPNGMLVTYFNGHAVFTESLRPCLALPDTNPQWINGTSMSAEQILARSAAGSARQRLSIFDCDYAQRWQVTLKADESVPPLEPIVGSRFLVGDHLVLRSGPSVSQPPLRSDKGQLTTALCDVLRSGIPHERRTITGSDLTGALTVALTRAGAAAPQADAQHGALDMPLFWNTTRSHQTAVTDEERLYDDA